MSTRGKYIRQDIVGYLIQAPTQTALRHINAPSIVCKQRTKGAPVKNTWKTTETSQEPHETAGEIFVRYVTERYPRHAAKLVARDAKCQVRTAECWLQEKKLPGNKHLFRLIDRYGADFVAALLRSVGKRLATREDVNVRLQKLSRDIRELKEITRHPRG